MLVSSTTPSPSTSTAADVTAPTPPRVRIRTLHVCEPSYPSREIVRQENYVRRQSQKEKGWCCPPGVPYQGIDPEHLPPKPSKTTPVRLDTSWWMKERSKESIWNDSEWWNRKYTHRKTHIEVDECWQWCESSEIHNKQPTRWSSGKSCSIYRYCVRFTDTVA